MSNKILQKPKETIGNFNKIRFGLNEIEIDPFSQLIKFKNLQNQDDDEVYIDIDTKESNLNIGQIQYLYQQYYLFQAQIRNMQSNIDRSGLFARIHINYYLEQLLKNFESTIELRASIDELKLIHYPQKPDVPLTLMLSQINQLENIQKIQTKNNITLIQNQINYLENIQTIHFQNSVVDHIVQVEDNLQAFIDKMKDYTEGNDGQNLGQWILSALNTLGVVGEGVGFGIWITAISAEVKAQQGQLLAQQAEITEVQGQLTVNTLQNQFKEWFSGIWGTVKRFYENYGAKIMQVVQTAQAVWQGTQQQQVSDAQAKLERLSEVIEIDKKDDINGEYIEFNQNLYFPNYNVTAQDITTQYAQCYNYDVILKLIIKRIDNIVDMIYEGLGLQRPSDISVIQYQPDQKIPSGTDPTIIDFEIQNRYNDLNQQITTVSDQVVTTNTAVSSARDNISSLQTTTSQQGTNIQSLQTTVSSINDSLTSVQKTVTGQSYNINSLNTHTQAIDSTITGMQKYLDNNITATQNVQSQANTNTSNISALQSSVASNTTAIGQIQTTTTNRLLGELVLIRKPTAWSSALPYGNLYVKNGVHYQILTSTNVALSNDSRYNDYAINYRGGAATIWMIQPQVPLSGYIYLEVIYVP